MNIHTRAERTHPIHIHTVGALSLRSEPTSLDPNTLTVLKLSLVVDISKSSGSPRLRSWRLAQVVDP